MNLKNPSILLPILKITALVSIIFTILLSTILVINFLQTSHSDPLNSTAMQKLLLKLEENPNDQAIKEEIRALDLLARRAFFTQRWQLRTGSYLLFAFVLIWLISLKSITAMRKNLPDLAKPMVKENEWITRKAVIITTLVIFAIAVPFIFLADNNFTTEQSADTTTITFASEAEIQNNWPNFRGPFGNGIAYDCTPPLTWNEEDNINILWKSPIDKPGYNSPIIWNEYIFLSGADKNSQKVYCINRADGSINWEKEISGIPGSPETPPRVSDDTGYAAPTMATNGQYVYAIFATGDLVCLNFTGEIIWSKNLGVPKNHYGHSSSLLTYKDKLLVQYDHSDSRQLLAFSATTGKTIYKAARDEMSISWASPLLFFHNDKPQLVLSTNPMVVAYNPDSGKELWRLKCMDGEVAPSPAYANGLLFVVNEFAKLAAIKPNVNPEIVWETEDDLSEVASPLAFGNMLIVATSFGIVTCFNNQSGEVLWTHEIDDGFYASPILANEHIYLFDMQGNGYIIKAEAEFSIVAETHLQDKIFATPACKENRLYIRSNKHLYAIGE